MIATWHLFIGTFGSRPSKERNPCGEPPSQISSAVLPKAELTCDLSSQVVERAQLPAALLKRIVCMAWEVLCFEGNFAWVLS